MKKKLLATIMLGICFAHGQNNSPKKSQILKLFKQSIRQEYKNKISTNSNPWVICNKDNSFYNSDTIKLYNNQNFYYCSNCCDFIDLTFYKDDSFVPTKAQMCKEPPTISVKAEWFTVQIKQKATILILQTFRENKLVDNFKVLEIKKVTDIGQKNDTTDVITLVRLR